MAKPTMISFPKNAVPRAETLLDRTTRAARLILDEESQQREAKTDRLRKARLEREASTKANTSPASRPRSKTRK